MDCVPRKARVSSTVTLPLTGLVVQTPLGATPAVSDSKSSQSSADWQTALSSGASPFSSSSESEQAREQEAMSARVGRARWRNEGISRFSKSDEHARACGRNGTPKRAVRQALRRSVEVHAVARRGAGAGG